MAQPNILPFPEKPTQSIIYVGPEMARRVLAKNTRNRPIQERHVQQLMREMESGRWKYNGEAIKWSVDDVLQDGQHRLTAISRMPDDFPAIPFLVVRGLAPDAQDTMDQGRKRTAGDQISIDGLAREGNQRIVAGAIRVYIEWVEGRFFGNQAVARISNPEIVEWAHRHPIQVQMLNDIASNRIRRVKARPSLVASVMLMFREIDGEAQREFFDALTSGAGLDEGNPILALREHLQMLRDRKGVVTPDRELVAFFIVAWNKWRDGKPLRMLKRPVGGGWTRDNFPEPK